MNAQDIWNEFRSSRFVVTETVKSMILEMKTRPIILRDIFLSSSGEYGLSELLVHAYYDSRVGLCKFLLENGVDPNRVKRYINPSFLELNNLFISYGYDPKLTEFYKNFYKNNRHIKWV